MVTANSLVPPSGVLGAGERGGRQEVGERVEVARDKYTMLCYDIIIVSLTVKLEDLEVAASPHDPG